MERHMRGENLYTEHAPSGTFRASVSRDGMAGSILDSIKVEPLDISQPLYEDEESQKDESSEDGTSSVPGTLPEGWRKIVARRKTGKTAWRHDVYFISPEGTKLRSKTALEKYLNTHHPEIKLEDFDYSVPSQQPSIKVEPLDILQPLYEDEESQKDEPSEDGTSSVPGTLPEGWRKIVTRRKTGKTAGKHDVYFISPEGTKLRSKSALKKYLDTNHPEIKLEDFDYSVSSQQQRHGTSIVTEFINMDNRDRSAILSGAPEEPKDCAEDRVGDHPEDRVGDHPEDRVGDHPEDRVGDHPEDRVGDHPEDRVGDHPEDPADDHPEDRAGDHAEDTQNTEEDPFIEDENDRTPTMKCVGRKRVRSHRKGSEKALRTVARIKRPRKYSSTKPEMATKIRKHKRRKNTVLKKPKKEDCIKIKDPTDLCDPVPATEDAEDQISTLPLEQQTEAENDQTASNSSDDNLLTSSGKTKDFITRSQVEKRKTSHYFSKKATRDVQTVKTQWCSMQDNYRRDLQQIKKDQRNASRASRMKSNFDEEEQDPSHVYPDEAETTSKRNQLCPLSPMVPDNTNSATTVEATQEAESEVAGLLTSQPSGRLGLVSSCSPSNQCRHREVENQLLLALNTFMEQRQAEQSPMYHFAVSLVPLLDKVSEDRVLDVRRHILDLITSYLSSDALPGRLYVYPFNCQSCNRQLCSPPPCLVHAPPQPPVQHGLPDQSTSEVQIPPRSCTPLTPTLSSQPSCHSPFEEQSSSPIKTGQTRLTFCTLF